MVNSIAKAGCLRLNEFDGDSNISYCMSQLGGCDLTEAAWFWGAGLYSDFD